MKQLHPPKNQPPRSVIDEEKVLIGIESSNSGYYIKNSNSEKIIKFIVTEKITRWGREEKKIREASKKSFQEV